MSREHPEKRYGQGETWIIEFSIRDALDRPISLEGAKILFQVAQKTKVVDLTSPCNEITITDTANGLGTIKVQPDLPVARYDWELWAILGSGEETRQAHGQIVIEPTIRKKFMASNQG